MLRVDPANTWICWRSVLEVSAPFPSPQELFLAFESWKDPGGSRRGKEEASGSGYLLTRKEALIFNNRLVMLSGVLGPACTIS